MDTVDNPPDKTKPMTPEAAAEEHGERSDAQAEHDHAEYLNHVLPSKKTKQKPNKRWLILIVTFICILLIGGAAYYFISSKRAPKNTTSHAANNKVVPSQQTDSGQLSHYNAPGNDINLSFDYPSNWSVSPATATDKTDQTITLNSPLTTLLAADGSNVTGRVSIRIRPANSGLTELADGKATTSQASVQFAYAKPTTNQFQYPYEIFIHIAGGVNPSGGFEEILVSGTTQFAKDQGITDTSVSVDPIITVNTYRCTTNTCSGTNALPLSITFDTWQTADVLVKAQAVLASLQIK